MRASSSNASIRQFRTGKALGQIGDNRATEPLIAALWDRHEVVRREAADALAKIDPDWAHSEAARQQVPEFIAALRDSNGYVRQAAAEALAKIDPDWARSEAASQQVPEFIVALGDKDIYVRLAAAEALGQIGDSRAVEPLLAALPSWHGYVYQAAEEASHSDTDGSWRLYFDHGLDQVPLKALVAIGMPAVEPLIAALRDENSLVCRTAMEALGQIGDSRAVEPLIAALV